MTPFEVISPPVGVSQVPVIFSIPHSGTVYPEDFDYSCAFELLQSAEDTLVDDLFSEAPSFGATVIRATMPRSYIDLNRSLDDVDPLLLAEPWPHPPPKDGRSGAGHGLIRRLIRPNGPEIYTRKLSISEINHRIESYYLPYHTALSGLIQTLWEKFGTVWIIDCHSMPSSAAFTLGTGIAVDIVLGDLDGAAFPLTSRTALQALWRERGYRVSVNDPYKGFEILRRHTRPIDKIYGLQIEFSKSIYLENDKDTKRNKYNKLKDDINVIYEEMRFLIK
ncbi:MAG: N-formylglutamate amidohydrolase [Alphaproteobacteria bacterium]|nr:N-formylglutamate amidohydrolase [Alphaproteobacteria bacterium]